MRGWISHYWSNTSHKFWVAFFMLRICARLTWRAVFHDLSKYSPAEARGFASAIGRLHGTTYGSDEYKELLKELEPTIQLHYKRNSHHPEHYPEGIDGMDMCDFVEMYCDWKAATRKHADGCIMQSIDRNTVRFEMPVMMKNVLSNTAKREK